MHFLGKAAVFSLLCTAWADITRRTYDDHDFFALHLGPSTSPDHVAKILGIHHEGPIGTLTGHHKFSLPKDRSPDVENTLEDLRARRKLRRRNPDAHHLAPRADGLDGILWSEKLSLQHRLHKRIPPPITPRLSSAQADPVAVQTLDRITAQLQITDPIFKDQWHLFNPVQLGHDLNVTGVWLQGISGQGVVTAIVDDGLDMYSNDLKDTYFPEGSYDYNEKQPEPKPQLFDDKHGTRCAGEVAAGRNNACGVGMAYNSRISGIRILSKPIDDVDEALSINHEFQKNHIYSCSWGPVDDGATMEAPGMLIKKAFVNGIQNGRAGKGSIFVFAAGNGGYHDDNCNFDGYTNSIYSITVGAIDREGNHPSYSEACSAQLVVAYSSGGGDAIHTTDVGADACTVSHGGTSAAGPLGAGTVALALSVRPDLTWRDIQYIMMEAAVPVHEEDKDWQVTKSGRKFSHIWGYGKIDAYAVVEKAKDWVLVQPQAWYHSPWLRVQQAIPQGDYGLASTFEVTTDALKGANIMRLEHVTVTMNVNHTRRGDLSVELRSPDGIVSHLSTTRRPDNAAQGYVDWTFMSVAHWGESGIGKWTLIVKDTEVNDFQGTFIDWRLNLWGEALDGASQPLHPMPDEHDDDHTVEDSVVATVSIERPETKTQPAQKPTDHIDRPVNEKPSENEAVPTATLPDNKPTITSEPTASPSPSSDSILPSFFPTFGASRRTQIWIYASLSLIIVFCLALGVYFQIQRRRRIRTNPNDDYEFEIIDEDDDSEGLMNGSSRKRRGGELYNAFAAESDEELLSGDEDGEEPYRDRPESESNEKTRKDSDGA